jgi:hypothetical protein
MTINPGRGYRVRLQARSFNGLGAQKDGIIYSCTKPVGAQTP